MMYLIEALVMSRKSRLEIERAQRCRDEGKRARRSKAMQLVRWLEAFGNQAGKERLKKSARQDRRRLSSG
jgi:hypothetical protein